MGRSTQRFRSIRTKLVGLTALVIAAIVVTLALYSSSHQVDLLRAEQRDQVQIYGATMSAQLRSAVAFSDRETSREVLSALDFEPDVAYVGLMDAGGTALYERGEPSTWVSRARLGVVASHTVDYAGRCAVVVPVLSLEGPRGTLIIELSDRRLAAQQRAIERRSIVLGGVLLLFGIIAASFVVRASVRRLRAIADVATAITNGSSYSTVQIDANDEIGAVATAFNAMVAQVQATNRELEARVEQRTADLVQANEQLRSEMEYRSRVELELRQAQKLESVGRLAAGIAHEINTPIHFAGDSVRFICEAAPEVLEVVKLQGAVVDAVLDGGAASELAARARSAADKVDLPFFTSELEPASSAALEGIERVAAIVQSMKTFSYQSAEMRSIDLNQAITSTLTVARNEYKYVADVETDLQELPQVTCRVGEINQAVLNILLNATHAIEDRVKGKCQRGRIVVSSRADHDHVVILIKDDGGGIPLSVRDRIFEPFFTTKPVGKGTGQGLAIAYSVIVDKHHGSLTFDTELGVGTTFRITIPIEHTDGAERAKAA